MGCAVPPLSPVTLPPSCCYNQVEVAPGSIVMEQTVFAIRKDSRRGSHAIARFAISKGTIIIRESPVAVSERGGLPVALEWHLVLLMLQCRSASWTEAYVRSSLNGEENNPHAIQYIKEKLPAVSECDIKTMFRCAS